jgi:predicted nucleic acid-binding protein
VIADTSGLLAFFDAADPHHQAVQETIRKLHEPLAVSPLVVAELDYLVATRVGVDAELAVLEELAGGAFDIVAADEADLHSALAVVARYRDQSIGLADAHQVVMAERLGTRDLLSLDHRHFDVVRPLQGGRFHLHPR